jgi:acetyl esterase/lipase
VNGCTLPESHAKSPSMSLATGTRAPSRWVWLVLMLALMTPLAAEVAGQGAIPRDATEHVMKEEPKETGGGALRTSDRIRDLLNHPRLAGYAHLMLPWDDRPYDPDTRLDDIGSLLPYHTHVVPEVVIGALNRIIGDAGNGNTVFFDFYTDEQKQADRSKARTGLFFFRGKPGAPFAIIAPGGGFSYVASMHEGFPHAAEISKRGFNAFVLKYRVGRGEVAATEDLAAAIAFVLEHADELRVSRSGYSLWGSSAGARMAATIGSHGAARSGGKPVPKPTTVVMAYTGHSDTAADEPPTFVVVGEQDTISPPTAMEKRIVALRRAGTPVEYRKFAGIGHGFGLGTGTRAEGWVAEANRFWEEAIRRVHRDRHEGLVGTRKHASNNS